MKISLQPILKRSLGNNQFSKKSLKFSALLRKSKKKSNKKSKLATASNSNRVNYVGKSRYVL